MCWGHYLPERTYTVGDHLLWRPDEEARPIPWAYFGNDRANIGDPLISPVYLPEPSEYGWTIRHCDHCAGPIDGSVVKVVDNVIASARLYLPGEFSPPEINEARLGEIIVYTEGPQGQPVLNLELSRHQLGSYDGEASPERQRLAITRDWPHQKGWNASSGT